MGLVGVTGVKSRWVCVAAGVIMVVLGLLPEWELPLASVPTFLLGTAGLARLGRLAATCMPIRRTVALTTHHDHSDTLRLHHALALDS